MSSKTKIVVLRLKEVIYTGIFVLLGIIVVVVLVTAFFPDNKNESTNVLSDNTLSANTQNSIAYIPGTYSASLILNDMAANIEIIVDESHISSVRFVELSEALKSKYPLLEPALSDISGQIIETQSLENLVYSDDMRYTATLLINAIESALEEATTDSLP